MSLRVEFIPDGVEDLRRYARSGNIRQFLQKLVRLETVGKQAGLPLGHGLSGYFKIVVGDRDWHIVFTVNADESVATVVVIGDRTDATCYEEALGRLALMRDQSTAAVSLAAAMLELPQLQKKNRR
jgi:mRNA interferase RelE/StbE